MKKILLGLLFLISTHAYSAEVINELNNDLNPVFHDLVIKEITLIPWIERTRVLAVACYNSNFDSILYVAGKSDSDSDVYDTGALRHEILVETEDCLEVGKLKNIYKEAHGSQLDIAFDLNTMKLIQIRLYMPTSTPTSTPSGK